MVLRWLEAGHVFLDLHDPDGNVTYSDPMTAKHEDDDTMGSQSPTHPRHVTVVGFLVIAGFLFVLAMVMLLLVAKYLSQRRRLAERDAPYHPTRRATKLRIQRRYETIEHWIISKRATPHDDFCSTVVSNFCHHKNKPTCTSRSGDCDSDTVNHDDSRSKDADDVEAPSSGGWPSGLECPPSPRSDSDPMECPSSSPKLEDEKTDENCLATRFVASRSSSSTPSEAMTDDELSDSGTKRAAPAGTSTDCSDNNNNNAILICASVQSAWANCRRVK